jgi:ribonuclease HI
MVVAVIPYFQLTTGATGNFWHFVLEDLRGTERFEVLDTEPALLGDRLHLLAMVRGLESLDRPSRLRIVTGNRYVYQGLTFGLRKWRNDGWRWESFGLLAPIKNVDLWQRVDQALKYHQIESTEFQLRPTSRNTVQLNESGSAAVLYHQRSRRAPLRIHRLRRMERMEAVASRDPDRQLVQAVA